MTDYNYLIDYLNEKGYNRSQITLDELNTTMVTTSRLRSNSIGSVIDIANPCNHKMTIMGKKQVPIGHDMRTSHSLRLALGNSEKEIDPLTRIRITKEKKDDSVIAICNEFYKDFSLENYEKDNTIDNIKISRRLKTDEDWYRFDTSIILEDTDHLVIYIINPDIDITNIRLALDMDLWYKSIIDELNLEKVWVI